MFTTKILVEFSPDHVLPYGIYCCLVSIQSTMIRIYLFSFKGNQVFQRILRHLYEGSKSYDNDPSSALAATFDSASVMEDAREAQKTFFSDLNYPNKHQYLAFPSYTCMSQFAEQKGCKNILEIGAGLSTAVWASLAEKTNARICTVDGSLARMKSYVSGTQHDALVSKHVELIEGVSIHNDEFLEFYTGAPLSSYGGVAITALREQINVFQNRHCSIKRRHRVKLVAGSRPWSARDLLTTESSLTFSRQLLNVFSSGNDFDNEIEFIKGAESRGIAGVISKLTQRESPWDFIFFDSGELASMIEWTKLKDSIAVGGFAAFHDIYFPKSIKNIIPCAAVMADPDWEVVFCDDSTKQGVLIAERLR